MHNTSVSKVFLFIFQLKRISINHAIMQLWTMDWLTELSLVNINTLLDIQVTIRCSLQTYHNFKHYNFYLNLKIK